MNLSRLRASSEAVAADFEADELADVRPQRAEVVLPLPTGSNTDGSGVSRYEVVVGGWRFEVAVESAARALLRERAERAGASIRPAGREQVKAQIPGRIVNVFAQAGATVATGERLLSIEAMKMENEVRAPRAGTIASVAVRPGQRVELGDELVVIE